MKYQILVILMIAALVTGCGGEKEATTATPTPEPAPKVEAIPPPPEAAAPTATKDMSAPGPATASSVRPEIALATTDTVAKLVEKNKGQVLVVNLWATWCPPCVAEMPELAAFYQAYPRDKVAFLSLSVDDPERLTQDVAPFAEKKKLPFPIHVFDGDLEALGDTLKVALTGAIPTTIVYGPEGTVEKVHLGEIDQATLKKVVDPLI